MSVSRDFPGVKVIVFDLDDTLCGYWDAAKAGLDATLEQFYAEPGERAAFKEAWILAFRDFIENLAGTHWYDKYLAEGETTRTELMRRALARVGITNEELAVALSNSYHQERHKRLALFPGAIETLERLHGKHPLCLLTNGPADIQRMELEALGISHFFDHVFIEGEQGHGKPKPVAFEAITKACNVEPSEVLMVGNSYKHDIRPAIQAGYHTIWMRRESDVSPTSLSGKVEEPPADAPAPEKIITDFSFFLD